MKTTTKPVGAFLTDKEYEQFKDAATRTNQDIGEAVRFALMYWTRIVLGGADGTDNSD